MGGEVAIGDYTKDGTVDLRGNPLLRRKTGRWRACSFIVVYEVFERMAYYGISSNLVLYLTNKLHQGTVIASNNVTNWAGTIWLTPLIGAYIADTYLGRYRTFIIGSIIYLSGMCLLISAVSIASLKPPPCDAGAVCISKASNLQLGVFFAGLYIIAAGTGGTKPNISTMGADQFDDFHPTEHALKLSFFNWWEFSIFFGTLLANTVVVYVQDNVGWTVGYILPTIGLAISVVIFLAGTKFYRHKKPIGSPLTRMAQVIFAAFRNRHVILPVNPKELHELGPEEYKKNGNFRIDHTPSLSILSKAAVKEGHSRRSPWGLCPVTQVEETKQMLRMVPILIATFIPSTTLAQVGTLFVKQGVTLDRHMGPNFSIPAASLSAFVTISMLVTIVVYDRFLVPFARRFTGNPRGISLLQRMGTGIVIHIGTMLVASFTEAHRLAVARAHGVAESGDTVPMTVFIILPQFLLMGIADAFLEVSKIEFFYDQAPQGMKSLGTSYSMATLGVGCFISSFLLETADRLTRRDGGRRGWILNNLNKSHLDYYYAVLAGLSVLNFLFFLVVCRFYVYRAEFVLEHEDEDAKNGSTAAINNGT
ncbi:Peptide transporter PTR3-A [Platanthera zijinensis]|uniref:Peptide transporter PTR3-A n=1 Tax=Platanthera zijinensis TaxID=2320716 RepID=A0AAP0C0U9_9ASPA